MLCLVCCPGGSPYIATKINEAKDLLDGQAKKQFNTHSGSDSVSLNLSIVSLGSFVSFSFHSDDPDQVCNPVTCRYVTLHPHHCLLLILTGQKGSPSGALRQSQGFVRFREASITFGQSLYLSLASVDVINSHRSYMYNKV